MTNEAPDSAYAELGKFVEAFELMVLMLRSGCVLILSSPAPKWQPLIQIPFNHSSMTAKPLADIFTAILGTMMNDQETIMSMNIDKKELDTFKGILSQVRADCEKIANKRNNILHGTWFVGINPDQEDISKFVVQKLTTTSTGLKLVESTPKNIEDIKEITKECSTLRDTICLLFSTWMFNNKPNISTLFRLNLNNKRWERINNSV